MVKSDPALDTPSSAHARLVSTFSSGVTLPVSFRKEQLLRLRRFLFETESDFIDALHKDLRRHRSEALVYEYMPLCSEFSYMLENLQSLTSDRSISRILGVPASITPSPKGVILIIGPFNFPILLLIRPLIAAFAAGNCVVFKPSELTPACASYIARLTSVLDRRVFAVVNGAADVAKELLTYRWDHIMFTGSARVGRLVMAAAAPNLTPVTLELGGQNPAFVSSSASLRGAAEAIARSRFINCGQICLATEYALVDESIYDEFKTVLLDVIKRMYNDKPSNCSYYGRLVSTVHWERVTKLLKATKGQVVLGGDTDDKDQHYVAPTVVEIQSADDPIMEEEVFGPVLTLLRVKNMDEAVEIVNARPSPLSVYVFGKSAVAKDIVKRTRSGSVGVNDTILQVQSEESFLGGFGESGMGAHGGARGFEEFSHMRPVLWAKPTHSILQRCLRPNFVAKGGFGETVMRYMGCMPYGQSNGVPLYEKVRKMFLVLVVAIAIVGISLGVGFGVRRSEKLI